MMRNIRIYQPSEYDLNSEVMLSKTACQHICKVLRLNCGDEIILFNGLGQSAIGQIQNNEAKSCSVLIKEKINEDTESFLKIHLGLGISKGDRMDYAIQKSVEAGVTEISPLVTERTIVKLDHKREQKRLEHWSGIIISACEQSGRSFLPKLNPIQNIDNWQNAESNCRLVFDCDAKQSLNELQAVDNVAILIGPEGGLSPTEIDVAHEQGFIKTKLGPRVLRTETAAVMACGVVQMLWGDYRS